ncbi:MAG: hypothetical protein Q4C87_04220 [Actinomycetaceae bacterium]|nr:hypothetical protein [Actinomycetaceae bacterium]
MAATWEDIENRCAYLFATALDETYVVFAGPHNYYVQFVVNEDDIHCEAVSDEFLDAEHQLTPDQKMALHNLGWADPDEYGNEVNWFVEHNRTRAQDNRTAAQRLVRTLREVYGITDTSELTLQSWCDQEGHEEDPLDIGLNLKRGVYEE